MSWTELDPGQGDPDALLVVAADLQLDADDAASAARTLRSIQGNTTDSVWSGSSADAFRDRIDKVPGHLDKLNASYADAAAGLRAYAAAVRQIADQARVQQRNLQQSQADLATAQLAQAGWTAPPHPATGLPDPVATNPHDAQVDSARTATTRAQARLSDLAGLRRTADGRLVAALHHAHSEGMKNKHWWQKALDVAADALAKITIVLMVVALVAIVVLAIVQPELIPGLFLAAGQVMTALSAAQLAVDGTRKASGEDVGWGSLALDAMGLLPGAGKLGTLAESVPVLSRGVTVLRDASETVRGFGAAGGAFLHSISTDLKATRLVVRVADTGLGTFMASVERDGKSAVRMLTDARDAAKGARSDWGNGRDFLISEDGLKTRSVNFKPKAQDPRWGLTKRHINRHLAGGGRYSLRVIDPGGSNAVWQPYLQSLATRPPTAMLNDGIFDVVGEFPRTDGSGLFRLGIRLSPKGDGTFDLVTILTRQ